MRRRRITSVSAITALALVFTALSATSGAAAPPPSGPEDALAVYSGTVDTGGLDAIVELGVDRHEIIAQPTADGMLDVEVILSGEQAGALADEGTTMTPKAPQSAARRSAAAAEESVFQTYSGSGGLQEEMMAQAAAHPRIAQLKVIGQSVNGQDIVAVRVTKNAARVKEGRRPTTVFLSAQHAREWITPEMTTRLLDRVLAGYGSDREITRLVNTTEMWFIPVANPDGYDYTFTEGNRLWRKNLRDNNGDGVITTGDGVDPNRNFPTRWGYDDEGSSPDPGSETYRGPSPASEPETRALDELFAKITPQFFVNYHSAAELLLYGLGWQVATPSPDDVIYEAMVGDDAAPAVPGYDPDLSAELYTTNGDTDSHMQEAHGTLGFTPEMATCESASAVDPDDEWEPDACNSGFEFPDDERLVAQEFEKNIPFALAVAASAADPDDPVSVTGLDTPDFKVDTFTVSYGDPQPVAVTAKKSLRSVRLNYSINGGRTTSVRVAEWDGGERYGTENTDYYAEYRGMVKGAKPGDSVEVWFSARPGSRDGYSGDRRSTMSERFTYSLAQDTGSEVLIIANEDYTGVNPTYPAGTAAPKYLDGYVAAFEAAGVQPDVWDVDAQGVPHDLAVLGHHDAVFWYLGDNRLTQDPEDELTTVGSQALPDISVAERAQYLTLSVRDFLNEGGKLGYSGETAGYYGALAGTVGGAFYGLNGAPDQPCVITQSLFDDCLIYADDFSQYYLGAFSRTSLQAGGVVGTAGPLEGVEVEFGGPAVVANPVDEAGAFRVTSDVLPEEQFPQFASSAVAEYVAPTGPFIPIEGEYAAAATHEDDTWFRLSRTFDLADVAAGDTATFDASFSYAVEEGYDNVIVEARTVGQEDWTTLPDLGGSTSTTPPAECEAGFYLDAQPALSRYLTGGNPCGSTGSSGSWNAFTGSSGGWTDVSFDLSGYAGAEVEVVVSYVTDSGAGDIGLIVDDTKLTTSAGVSQQEGFEEGLGAWQVLGPPEGSSPASSAFERTRGLGGVVSAVTTPDTILFGFGLEQLSTDDRAAALERMMDRLAG